MSSFTVFVFLLLSICLASGLTGDCSDKADGNYEIGCRSYLSCVGGVATIINCPDPPNTNTVYNNVTKKCDDPANVGLPCGQIEDCTNTPDGRYPDMFNNCKSYYTCSGGVFFGHNHCNAGLVFDPSQQICNWPANVAPPCGTHSTG